MKKILLLVPIILVICTIYFNHLYNTTRFFSEDEIIEVFKDEKETFVDSSLTLRKYKGFWSIRKKVYGLEYRPDWEDVILCNDLHFVIHDSLSHEMNLIKCEIEKNESIEKILKVLHFKIITCNMRIDKACILHQANKAII